MKHIILILTIALSLSAQETRKFPLSNSDYPAYFDLLGSRRVLMSPLTILRKIESTYGDNKYAEYTQIGLTLCVTNKNMDMTEDVITGVKVFTDRFGLVRVTVNFNDGQSATVTMNEIIKAKHALLASEE
jgi:hypothetical protein